MTFRRVDKNNAGYIVTVPLMVDAISEAMANTVDALSLLKDAEPSEPHSVTIVPNAESMEPGELRQRADLNAKYAAMARQREHDARDKQRAITEAVNSPDFQAAIEAACRWLIADAERQSIEAARYTEYAARLSALADEKDARRKAATLEGRVESLEAELRRLQHAKSK